MYPPTRACPYFSFVVVFGNAIKSTVALIRKGWAKVKPHIMRRGTTAEIQLHRNALRVALSSRWGPAEMFHAVCSFSPASFPRRVSSISGISLFLRILEKPILKTGKTQVKRLLSHNPEVCSFAKLL
jgi:hypothetical protein